MCLGQQLCRAQHGGQQQLDFLLAAARQQQYRMLVCLQLEIFSGLCLGQFRPYTVHERVADEGNLCACLLVDG